MGVQALDPDICLPRHVDDRIGAMVYSFIGETSVESQLRHHLGLSERSVAHLHAQLKDLQVKHRSLEQKYDTSKEENSLNATALKQKISEYNSLKASYEQLLKECELFRTDREIFAEAADDAEERRAEADRRAVEAENWANEAEERAAEAERREKEAVKFIEAILKAPPKEKLQMLSSPRVKAKWGRSDTLTEDPKTCHLSHRNHMHADQEKQVSCVSDTPTKHKMSKSVKQAGSVDVQIPHCKEGRGTKRILFDASRSRGGTRNSIRQKIGKNALMDRSKFRGAICKISRVQEEKENHSDFEAEVTAKIQEASRSENETIRYLADLLVVLKKNLVKAEAEGDVLYAKYCEIHRLLMDTLSTFGILPDVLEGKLSAPTSNDSVESGAI